MKSESTVISQTPCISIVMATYNGERFLAKQLYSHLEQSYPNLEFIYLDDCSSDKTWEILQEFEQKDPRVKIYRNEQNIGYIKTFEKAMQLATSELIALSDQDDIWLPNKLKDLYQSLGNYSLIYSDSALIDSNDSKLGRFMSDIKKQIAYHTPLMYTFGAWAPGHSMLFRKDIIPQEFHFPTFVTHDYTLGFLATCKQGINYIPEPLVLYRQHNQNLVGADTQKKKQKQEKEQKIERILQRMAFLAANCPDSIPNEKQIFEKLSRSFASSSLQARWNRFLIVFRHRNTMLAYKNKNKIGKILYPFKLLLAIY